MLSGPGTRFLFISTVQVWEDTHKNLVVKPLKKKGGGLTAYMSVKALSPLCPNGHMRKNVFFSSCIKVYVFETRKA